ncbi:MAG: flagellar filament capping protein FliD [Methylophilaceae bacterium]
MAISSPGIGSNLDVNSIVTGLMSTEQGPLNNVTKQKTAVQAKISAFGSLKSSLASFQTALGNLATSDKFNAQAIKVGDSSLFSATANGKATNGDYAVKVTQLAQNQKLALPGFASKADIVGSGTITIDFGSYNSLGNSFSLNPEKTSKTITIAPGSDSLQGIRDAINAADAGVTASIINDGSSNGNRLVITSKDTGTTNSLKISVADGDGNNLDSTGLSALAFDPTLSSGSGKNLMQLQEAKDALLNVDGVDIVKASNTISDAVEGITLNLLKVGTAVPTNLNVSTDAEAIKTSVNAFAKAYNDLNTTLRNLTKYDAVSKTGGALQGDATARSISSQIKNALTGTLSSGGAFNSLSQVGVAFQRDGTLAVDSTKLQSAIDKNFSDIAGLFANSAKFTDPQITFSASGSKTKSGTYAITVAQLGSGAINAQGTINGVTATGSGQSLTGATGDPSEGLAIKVAGGALGARGTVNFSVGFAKQLNNMVSNFLSSDGLLTAKTDGLNSSITRLTDRQQVEQDHLTQIEKRYRAQFTALDRVMSSMSQTSTFLTQQIAQYNKA